MANIMTMKKLENKTSRNGFDLSRKNIFSAKVGELLPCACIECIPGDSFQIKTKHLTRTMPLNTAAYTRIREYYDWFFVPTNLLWNKFNTFVTQMGNNNQQADSITTPVSTSDTHPYLSTESIHRYLTNQSLPDAVNIFGYNRMDNTRKLLEYLDYGQFYTSDGTVINGSNENVGLNPFPLLAYQKIYSDYYRNSQWEDAFAPAFNINYLSSGNDDIPVADTDFSQSPYTMFDLHYANWHKDYFMGLLPNSQYGDVASVNVSSLLSSSGMTSANVALQSWSAQPNSNVTIDSENLLTAGGSVNWKFPSAQISNIANSIGLSDGSLIGAFTILALRNAEAMQRWAEITQSQQQDYQSQVDAHFGVKVSDAYSERCTWIGGGDSTMDIGEVINTNLPDDASIANIKGKGIGSGDDFCKFETKVHGYLMCIYHAVPMLDYAMSGIPRMNLKTKVTDYAIPEFDKTGMVSVPRHELYIQGVGRPTPYLAELLGYAPRYYDYKTSYDRVKGAFVHGGLEKWVAPVTSDYLNELMNSSSNGSLDYRFFKVNPAFLNPIFVTPAGDMVDSDQLLVNTYFDIKAVRNLDRDGLPY